MSWNDLSHSELLDCLPYAIGDILWVREAHAVLPPFAPGYEPTVLCRADWPNKSPATTVNEWRPSIFMPRWASRLTLIVTERRVQRVQGISAHDSLMEGAQCETCQAMRRSACRGMGCFASLQAFCNHWNSRHGPDAWDRNDWVAAYTFTVHHQNIDALGVE